METIKCKRCRRASEKLFLKGERCFTAKCAFTRKPQVPGLSSKKFRRNLSEYGRQLREKQKVKFSYGVKEEQFSNYVKKAVSGASKDSSGSLFDLIERRLDNVVFRLGFCDCRARARQAVSHGHVTINGRKVDIPSYLVNIGDKIGIKKTSEEKGVFKDIEIRLNKDSSPDWIKIDSENKQGEIVAKPDLGQEEGMTAKLNQTIEFYSR